MQCACAAGFCDGLYLNDLEKWILMDLRYLIFDFLDFRCKTLNIFYLTGSVLHNFSDHYKIACTTQTTTK